MIEIQTYQIDNDQGFNKLIKEIGCSNDTHYRINEGHLIAIYDDGKPLSNQSKVQSLYFELRKTEELILQFERQYRQKVAKLESDEVLEKECAIEIENIENQITVLENAENSSENYEKRKELKKLLNHKKQSEYPILVQTVTGMKNQIAVAKRQWEVEQISAKVIQEMIDELK